MSRNTSQNIRITICCLSALLWRATTPAHALDIHWNGSGNPFGTNSDSWQNPENWDFAGSPFGVQRVPSDVDTATLTTPADDFVNLYSNSAPINRLTLSNGINLGTGGFLLKVDDGGLGLTEIYDGAHLNVQERPSGTAFVTDNLQFNAGGELRLLGGAALVEGATVLLSDSKITNAPIFPIVLEGTITFGGDVSLSDSTLEMFGNGRANFAPNSTIKLEGFSRIELAQPLTIDTGTTFELLTNSTLIVGGATAIGPTGTLNIKSSGFRPGGDVLVDGGTIRIADGPNLGTMVLPVGGKFTASNGGQVHIDHKTLLISDGQRFTFDSGADVTHTGLSSILVGALETAGELLVDGIGTTVDLNSINVGTSAPGQSIATVRNGATMTLEGLYLNSSFFPQSPHPNQAIMNIESGAVVTGPTSIFVGAVGALSTSFAHLNLTTGATLTQAEGSGENQVGSVIDGQGRIMVSEGAIYTSNSNYFKITHKGHVVVQGGTQAGTMNINGPMTIAGSVDVMAGGTQPNNPGGILHVTAPMTIDGGTVSLSKGVMTATTISFANSGDFNFDGGKLSVGTFNNSLTNTGGTLAPGSSAGSTTIVGDYTQQTNATLEIEIGGTAAVTQHDFVKISGNVLLDGLLELSLLNSFTPAAADTFTVLSAGNLTGFFDNATSGARLDTIDGLGSFLVDLDFDADQIVLSDFLPSRPDLDNDRDVDGNDFLLIQRGNPALIATWETQFGTGLGTLTQSLQQENTSHAVPEPTTLLLSAFLALSYAFANTRSQGLCSRATAARWRETEPYRYVAGE